MIIVTDMYKAQDHLRDTSSRFRIVKKVFSCVIRVFTETLVELCR